MAKMKNAKKAFISSLLALTLSGTMMVGTTYAWFTDSVTSGSNVIQSGTLKVGMYWAEGKNNPETTAWKNAEEGAIFSSTLWEPGKVEARHLKIVNEGSLAFKYKLLIVPNGTVSALADVIDVYFIKGAQNVTRAQLAALTPVGTLADMINDQDGAIHGALLAKDETPTSTYEMAGEATATIAFKMKETAGNEYQGISIGSDFAIQLLATQYTYEGDSFDNGYDADAEYPNISVPVKIPETAAPVTLALGGMKVNVPTEVVENLDADVTSMSLTYSTPTVENNAIKFASVDLVDQDGNKIDLEGNTEELTVTLPAQEVFTEGQLVYVYHDGEYVDMATVNADKTISYEVTHFCEVSVYGKYLEEYFLPAGITESSFGANVAYTNGQFYKTLKDALLAIHNANVEESTLYLKPNANLGTVTHAHVCSSITVFGNGAYITGGERDFEIGVPGSTGVSCSIDCPINLTVYDLDGCAVWGGIPKNATVNISLNDCQNVSKIVFPHYDATARNYDLNITINNCSFVGTAAYNDSAIWCRELDSLKVTNTTFKDYLKGINQNNKDAEENHYTLTNCTFIDCSTTAQTKDAAPVRAVASKAGAVTTLVMNGCKFVYTSDKTAVNGDIITYEDGNQGTVYATIDGVAK